MRSNKDSDREINKDKKGNKGSNEGSDRDIGAITGRTAISVAR